MRIVCKHCGKVRHFKPSEIKRGGGKYCSNSCRAKALNKGRKGEYTRGSNPSQENKDGKSK